MNEYSVVLYNHGEMDRYREYADRVKKERWSLLTTSKYFETRVANVLFRKLENQSKDWSGS
jgi:hypothetical protein